MTAFPIIVAFALSIIAGSLNTAQAATFKVGNYDDGSTYIYMEGQTEQYDEVRFAKALELAMNSTMEKEECVTFTTETENGIIEEDFCETIEVTREFSEDLYLTGPGGHAAAGWNTALSVREAGLTTIAWGECISACSTIWLGGTEREISTIVPSKVGFHFSYLPNAARPLGDMKENLGWVGIQDFVSKNTAYSLAQDLYFGIAKPELFVINMVKSGSQVLFWVDNDNLHIIGKYPKEVVLQ